MTTMTQKEKMKPSIIAPKPKVSKSPAGKLNLAGLKAGASLSTDKVTTVDTFLKTGESDAYWGSFPCVREDGGNPSIFVIRRNGSLISCGHFSSAPAVAPYFLPRCGVAWIKASDAVLVKSSKPKLRKFDLILNGDEMDDADPSVLLEDKSAGITASFDIFAELLAPKGKRIPESRILGWLNDGSIRILDSSPDETRKLNPATQRKVSALKEKNSNRQPALVKLRKAIRPPEAGFTLMGSSGGLQWHRAATVLFRYGKTVYLIGQDEGTYFGCQLADHPETIKEAYLSLMPEKVRKITGPLRQGEWFAIPVPVSEVPKLEQCIASFSLYTETTCNLPCDDKESKTHSVSSDDGRISAAGIFVCGGTLSHEEHEDLDIPKKKWMTFVKNTAVRSVSREGVD